LAEVVEVGRAVDCPGEGCAASLPRATSHARVDIQDLAIALAGEWLSVAGRVRQHDIECVLPCAAVVGALRFEAALRRGGRGVATVRYAGLEAARFGAVVLALSSSLRNGVLGRVCALPVGVLLDVAAAVGELVARAADTFR
jgi:hypothetical protein